MLEFVWCPERERKGTVDWRRCKVEEMDAEMQAPRWREERQPVPAASSKALSLRFPGNSLGWVRLGLAASHTCGLGKWLGQPGASHRGILALQLPGTNAQVRPVATDH